MTEGSRLVIRQQILRCAQDDTEIHVPVYHTGRSVSENIPAVAAHHFQDFLAL